MDHALRDNLEVASRVCSRNIWECASGRVSVGAGAVDLASVSAHIDVVLLRVEQRSCQTCTSDSVGAATLERASQARCAVSQCQVVVDRDASDGSNDLQTSIDERDQPPTAIAWDEAD